jgi:hypothetical protein
MGREEMGDAWSSNRVYIGCKMIQTPPGSPTKRGQIVGGSDWKRRKATEAKGRKDREQELNKK